MKKKYILRVVLIILVGVMFFGTIVADAATGFDTYGVDGFELNAGQSVPSTVTNLTDQTMGTAISVARTVGVGVAITILMVIAVKYMIASPGDRADIKKNAVPFVIGAVVLFGASGILGLLAEFSSTISVK